MQLRILHPHCFWGVKMDKQARTLAKMNRFWRWRPGALVSSMATHVPKRAPRGFLRRTGAIGLGEHESSCLPDRWLTDESSLSELSGTQTVFVCYGDMDGCVSKTRRQKIEFGLSTVHQP